MSIVAGIFNDLNPANQNNQNVGFWNEFDWFTGVNFNFMKNWTLGVQYVAFISPPGNFKTEHNLEFNLGYDDGGKWVAPISIKPYAKLFFTAAGDSTVVLGQVPSFDVELGGIPTWDLHLYQIPLTLTVPTWITVGPSNFWGGSSNFGVFSTGINAKIRARLLFPSGSGSGRSISASNTTIYQFPIARRAGSHRRRQSRIERVPQRLRICCRSGVSFLTRCQQPVTAAERIPSWRSSMRSLIPSI